VFWSILHRMILWELARVFLLSLLGITGILLMAGIVAEATQHGLSPAQILMVIPLLIPSTLPYTIPATTLFATCVVYGRLAHDNEILAIKAAGIHLGRVVWPGVLLGLVMSGVTMGLYFHVIPSTHHLMRTKFLNDVEEVLYTLLKKDRCINQPHMNYAMWARQVQGRKLIDPLFKRRDPKGGYDIIARSQEAELRVNMAKRKIEVKMRKCNAFNETGQHRGYFEERIWEVDLPNDFINMRKRRASDLVWSEIFALREEAESEKEKLEAKIELLRSRKLLPDEVLAEIQHLSNQRQGKQNDIQNLNLELQMRPALALGCLCFVLVGCPVGIWFSRSDYLSAFITCFLPIVFFYYPLLLCGINLAKSGRITPVVSLWVADGAMAICAAMLYRRLLRN
jgi:lipopolysaccharide export system permease protein